MPRETRSARPGSARVGDAAPSVRAVRKGVFRKEGEYWTVGYGGRAFRLKDSKGLGYLAHLLRHPGAEFHVLDLAGGIAGRRDDDEPGQSEQGLPRGDEELEKAGIHIGSLGDAGEMLDEQAKVAYRRRLSELREELDTNSRSGPEPFDEPWPRSNSTFDQNYLAAFVLRVRAAFLSRGAEP